MLKQSSFTQYVAAILFELRTGVLIPGDEDGIINVMVMAFLKTASLQASFEVVGRRCPGFP